MKKRLCVLLLAFTLLVSAASAQELHRYTASFLSLFDTVTILVGYETDKESFAETAERFRTELEQHHQLYDIYRDYPGMNNLKTVNDNAGVAPVQVDQRVIDLLLFCREMYEITGGAVDATMGSVLRLWHDARTAAFDDPEGARLPDVSVLREAAQHRGFDSVIIDAEAGTVFITDPLLLLDVGAIAKGYAVEQVCRDMPAGMLVSVGGNVIATGPNPATGEVWRVGIQNPRGAMSENIHIIYVEKGSVVTSGDYQRAFAVDGEIYHHIINPDTLFPGNLWKAVTVLCPDSGVADALSTALFLLSQEDGQRLLDHFGAEAVWCAPDGSVLYSPGYEMFIVP